MFKKLKELLAREKYIEITVNSDEKSIFSQPGLIEEKHALPREQEMSELRHRLVEPSEISISYNQESYKILDYNSFKRKIFKHYNKNGTSNWDMFIEEFGRELSYHGKKLLRDDDIKTTKQLALFANIAPIAVTLTFADYIFLFDRNQADNQSVVLIFNQMEKFINIREYSRILSSTKYSFIHDKVRELIINNLKMLNSQDTIEAYIDILWKCSFREHHALPSYLTNLVKGFVNENNVGALIEMLDKAKKMFRFNVEENKQKMIEAGYKIVKIEDKEYVVCYKALTLGKQSMFDNSMVYNNNDSYTVCNYDKSGETSFGFGGWTFEKALEFGKIHAPISQNHADGTEKKNYVKIVECLMDVNHVLCLHNHSNKLRSAHIKLIRSVMDSIDVYDESLQLEAPVEDIGTQVVTHIRSITS